MSFRPSQQITPAVPFRGTFPAPFAPVAATTSASIPVPTSKALVVLFTSVDAGRVGTEMRVVS